MTRRGVLIGALLLAAGELVRADRRQQGLLSSATAVWEPEPWKLVFDFTSNGGFSVLELKFPGKTITFTADELRRELEATP